MADDGLTSVDFGGTIIGVGASYGIAAITGDDWAGMFQPGDLMLYDKGKTSTAVPGLFAIKVRGDEMIRRVTPGPKSATMSCSNERYPPMPMGNEHKALGRVIGRVHRI